MLIGEKVLLRPLTEGDLPKINKWRNDLELTKLTMGVRYPISLTMDKEWLDNVLRDKSNRSLYWAITIKNSSDFIGLASLTSIDNVSGTCVFGRMIGDENNRGMGYGKETEKIVREYAFDILNLRKITRHIVDHNQRSVSILRNQGLAVEEGRLKEHFYMDGKYHDIIILSIFRDKC